MDKYAAQKSIFTEVNVAMACYGYLSYNEEDKSIIPKVNHSFFKTLPETIRHGLYCDTSGEKKENRHYFKILNYKDVVNYIHHTCISKDKTTFGFVYLYIKDENVELFSACNKLYDNMLECVLEEKSFLEEEICLNQDYKIKVGYFVLLDDKSVIKELHSRPVTV